MAVLLQYTDIISSLASVGMMFIWLVYLQLFLQDYRSRRRPRLLIQQADATQPDQSCSLINMSSMHMDVLCVLVVSHTRDRERSRPLRRAEHELSGFPDQAERKKARHIKHGPLAPGESLLIGSFQELVDWATSGGENEDRRPDSFEIRVIFLHGMWDQPHGSSRTFRLAYRDDQLEAVKPMTLHTIHLTSRRQRRQVEAWYDDVLECS